MSRWVEEEKVEIITEHLSAVREHLSRFGPKEYWMIHTLSYNINEGLFKFPTLLPLNH